MIALVPHPSMAASAWEISADADRGSDGELRLRWLLRGVDDMRVSAPGPLRRGDRLWEHTCAEAFVAAEDGDAYVELNVTPSREWAAYGFASYRDGAPLAATALEPEIVVRRERDTLAIVALVPLADLSASFATAALRVGLTVVVEAADGRLSYWALHHPAARPDFHDARGFTLRLGEPGERGSSA